MNKLVNVAVVDYGIGTGMYLIPEAMHPVYTGAFVKIPYSDAICTGTYCYGRVLEIQHKPYSCMHLEEIEELLVPF